MPWPVNITVIMRVILLVGFIALAGLPAGCNMSFRNGTFAQHPIYFFLHGCLDWESQFINSAITRNFSGGKKYSIFIRK